MLMIVLSIVIGIWTTSIVGQSPIIDSRCYLEGGGSAENFLASEDVTVSSIIGKLRINGDPSIDIGDINLSLRERDSPITISPGTKDIVLITPLDKEGVRGPASVYVNVICDRRHTNDPSFVIPVNIRVTDINDNSPKWIGAPYLLSLSEVTVIGTRILQGARAIDLDQPGPFSTVEYQVLPGPYSDYVSFVSPLEGTLVLKKTLDYETLKNFTVKLRAQDQGTPTKFSDTSLRVTITDADDQNPKFQRDSYYGELPPDGATGDVKISPEPIKAIDQDEGLQSVLQYSISQSAESRFFSISAKTGVINLISPLGPTDLTYTITLVVKATQIDNADRYALTTVIISKKGNRIVNGDKLSFSQSKYHAKVREDLGVGSRILALPTNRPGKYLQFYILNNDENKYFSIGSLGELILRKTLDFEKSTVHMFPVVANDGISNATTDVQIDVIDINDWEPRFRQTHYEFNMPSMHLYKEPVALGKLEAADGDVNDKITLNIKGPHSFFFTIDSRGVLWFKGEKPNVTVVHLLATATDSGIPTKSSSVPVTIIIEDPVASEASWASGMLGAFGVVMGLFILVIIAMSAYIYKTKKPKLRNRVHSHGNSTTSAATLVTRDKILGSLHLGGGNMTQGNVMNTHGGSGSSISAGASTILAASLERETQRARERDNYTATVRSIISRAQAARNGQLYDDGIERDSITNSETARTTWNTLQNSPKDVNVGISTSNLRKKLSWDNDEDLRNSKTDITRSTDMMGSTENNLTVYF